MLKKTLSILSSFTNYTNTVFTCSLVVGIGLALPATYVLAANTTPPDESKQSSSTPSPNESEPELTEATPPVKSSGKWLPIPVVLTEPAFGYGLGVALAYFHPEKKSTEASGLENNQSVHTLNSLSSSASDQKPPPTITSVAGGYTANDTWATAVAHSASWRNDTIRYTGGLAYANVNSDFYILDIPFGFNLKGTAFYQDIKFRLGKSRLFLGGKLVVLKTDSLFDVSVGEQETKIELGEISAKNTGIAAQLTFDGRDNVFTPNHGEFFQLDVWRYDKSFGGDYDYWSGKLKLLSFLQLHPKFVLGLRFDVAAVDGTAPFYAYPWVSLRGIPAMRYQGDSAGAVEAEVRWNVLPRWAVVGFTGAGNVDGDDPSFTTEDKVYAGGAGVRYFMMRDMGLWLGVDLAGGPEDVYAYITIGQAW